MINLMHPHDAHVRKTRKEMFLDETGMHRRLILNMNIAFDYLDDLLS